MLPAFLGLIQRIKPKKLAAPGKRRFFIFTTEEKEQCFFSFFFLKKTEKIIKTKLLVRLTALTSFAGSRLDLRKEVQSQPSLSFGLPRISAEIRGHFSA